MAWIEKSYEFISRVFSRWSAELSALITVALTLMALGLIDIWVIKMILTIAIFLFFAGVVHKFILSVYKQHIDTMKEIKNGKEVNEVSQQTFQKD